MSDYVNTDTWKVFWKITFDVVAGQVVLKEELTLWNKVDTNRPVRLDRTVVALQYTLRGAVQIEYDRALFEGGYIEAISSDKQAYIDSLELAGILPSASNAILGGVAEIVGETVSIQTNVRLQHVEPHNGRSPIFHYPQHPNLNPGVELSRFYDGLNDYYALEWSISGNPLPPGAAIGSPYTSPSGFQLQDGDGWHRLRVRQGGGINAPVFDFAVDSVPLGTLPVEATPIGLVEPVAIGVHLFEPAPQTFYIGATPDHLNNYGDGLYGEISHLEFDPNDSCGSCAG